MAKTIKIKAPAGTSGYAVEPWAKGEIYAVVANWAQASAPVYTYGANGWVPDRCGRQVADFLHSPTDALRAEIRDVIAVSENIPGDDVDDDEIEGIVSDAVEIDDAE